MGTIYRRGSKWWIKWHRSGRAFYESSGSETYEDARNLLRLREGDVARGVKITPAMTRVTIDELLADVVTDYTINNKRSLADLKRRIDLHLLPHFRGWRAAEIQAADVRRYVELRQAAKASNAQINRELAALRRAYVLGVDGEKVRDRPKIAMLEENNVREGFFEPAQFEAVRAKLPEPLRPVITFAYLTGWRVHAEVLKLQWRQVDFAAGRVRLEPGTTKNKAGRWFPFTADLRALLDAQRAHTDAVNREHGILCQWVFHREGRPIRWFYDAWRTACTAAGVPGRIPHDFRRTAVRNLVRRGVPQRVAMKLTGHKTDAVFARYDIIDERDLDGAAALLNGATVTDSVTVGRSARGARARK